MYSSGLLKASDVVGDGDDVYDQLQVEMRVQFS